MLYAYFWACRLSIEVLPTSLKNVETRAILIDKIDMPLTVENNTANLLLEYMSQDERVFRLNKVLGIANSFLLEYHLKHQRKTLFYVFGQGAWMLPRALR